MTGNADGVLLTDDYAPNSYNLVEHNVVNDNLTECGIVLPSHSQNAVTLRPDNDRRSPGVNPTLGWCLRQLVIEQRRRRQRHR